MIVNIHIIIFPNQSCQDRLRALLIKLSGFVGTKFQHRIRFFLFFFQYQVWKFYFKHHTHNILYNKISFQSHEYTTLPVFCFFQSSRSTQIVIPIIVTLTYFKAIQLKRPLQAVTQDSTQENF